jgi:hypothetical protein
VDFHRYDSRPTYLQIEKRPQPALVKSPMSQAQKIGALLRLFGWAAVFFASALLLLGGLGGFSQLWVLNSWTKTEGQVVNAEVYSDTDHVSNPPVTLYGVRCVVSFIAQGQSRVASLDFGNLSSKPAEADQWSQRFPQGSRISIVFDPADPSRLRSAGDYPASYLGPIRALELAGWLLLLGVPAVLASKRLLASAEQIVAQESFPQGVLTPILTADKKPLFRE